MWVRSSFPDGPAAAPLPRRRPRPARQPAAAADSANRGGGGGGGGGGGAGLWADRHRPRCCQELAVQRAKVEEVELWLTATQRRLAGGAAASPFLLLTGPAGCGKSACVRCLAERLDMLLAEWTTPTAGRRRRQDDLFTADDVWEGPGDTVTAEGQLRQFSDFLMRANRYGSVLPTGGSKTRLVVVDDLPSALVYRKDEFYDILRRYGRGARSPCVFVMNEGGARSDLSVLSVFPDSIQAELGIHQISFRPVANKQLVIAMERVLAVETSGPGGVCHPGRVVLEELAAASSGDVRAAINALQFVCVQGQSQKSAGPKRRARESGRAPPKKPYRPDEAAVGSRDATLGLFRAVGKIIYAKRGTGEEPALPGHLTSLRRAPLLEKSPEEICDRAGVQPGTVIAHLHHNYPDFCPQLEDAVTSATYISDADLLTADWQSRLTMLAYGSSVACRGVMFARPSSISLGFRQFSQPRLTAVEQQRRSRLESLRLCFADWRVTNEALLTELLPYLDRRAPGYRPSLSSLPYNDPSFYRSLHHPALERTGSSDEEEEDELEIEEYAD